MTSGKHLSIRTAFILLFAALSLFAGGVISYISFSRGFGAARDAVDRMNREMNEVASWSIGKFLAVPAGLNRTISILLEKGFINMDHEEERERFFRGIMEEYSGQFSCVFFETPQKKRYGIRYGPEGFSEFLRPDEKKGGFSWYSAESGRLVEHLIPSCTKDSSLFMEIMEKGKPAYFTVCGNNALPGPAVSAVHPVYDSDGNALGVIGTQVLFSALEPEIQQAVQYEKAFSAVFNKKDMCLLAFFRHGEKGQAEEAAGATGTAGTEILEYIRRQYQSTGEKAFISETPDGRFFTFFSEYHREGLELAILTALPEDLHTAIIRKNARFSGLLLLISQLVSIGIYMKVAKKLLSPVTVLVKTAEEFAGGNFSARAPMVRDDEIGLIAGAFNQMAGTVSSLFGNLEKIVEDRTTELQRRNRELEQQTMKTAESRNMLQLLLDSTGDAVFGMDIRGNCTFCNRSFLRIMGFESPETLQGQNLHSLIHHSDACGSPIIPSRCRICLSLLTGENVHADEEVFWRADGTPLEVEYHAYPQLLDGEVVGVMVSFTDNSEQRKNRAKINYLNSHDPLTGLFNRAYFEKELKRTDLRENLPITVIFGDINGLKLTNDVFGHSAGDLLLKTAAELLKKTCREKDTVARLGGDEFAVIMTNTASTEADRIMQRIKNDFREEKVIAIRGSISMGYGTKTDPDQDLAAVVLTAEEAMYREKILFRKDIDSEMEDTIMETLHEKSPREKIHSLSMQTLCGMIGETLGLSGTETGKLKAAGYLHDIGKVVLDQKILNREDGLVEEEEDKKELLLHTAAGYRILNLFDTTLEYSEWILCHHENWDGSGFPNGIRGKDIPFQARILRVAEFWDRLRMQFKDSPGWEEHAVRELKKAAGTILDPMVVDALTARS